MFKINVLGTHQGRHPQDLFSECFEDVHWSWKNIQQLIVFNTTHFPANISCFPRFLQDVFAIRLPKTSSRHLEYFFKTSSRNLPRRLFQDVFKTSSKRHLAIMSWRHLGRQKNVTLKTSSRRVQHAFTKTNVCWLGE